MFSGSVPDCVLPIHVWRFKWDLYFVHPSHHQYKDSLFIEITIDTQITPKSRKGEQLLKMIEALAGSPAAKALRSGKDFCRPQLVLITPWASNQIVSQQIIDAATKAGVELWHSTLVETKSRGGLPVVGLGPEKNLNGPALGSFNLPITFLQLFSAIPIM